MVVAVPLTLMNCTIPYDVFAAKTSSYNNELNKLNKFPTNQLKALQHKLRYHYVYYIFH